MTLPARDSHALGAATEGLRVLVCGGRDYRDARRLRDIMDALHAKRPIALLIHGDALGADLLAEAWADARGVALRAYPAEWKKHGKGAGPIRNRQMLTEGRPDLVVAFPGGRGTADMVRQAEAAGVKVLLVPDQDAAEGLR